MCVCVCVCRDRQGGGLIDYKRMAHVTMEAEKSHDLHLQVGDLNESQWCSLKARQPKSWILVEV